MSNTKKIEDYLKYYLGCEVLINNRSLENKMDKLSYLNEFGDCGGNQFEWLAADCQPILRKLEDITEEECNEYNRRSETLYSLNDNHNQVRQNAECVHYLLSKHFDLFGLIEAGLAIDKTQQ